jgi:peptidoglycan hydrolase-like protein with peptidoglycan-binding domain
MSYTAATIPYGGGGNGGGNGSGAVISQLATSNTPNTNGNVLGATVSAVASDGKAKGQVLGATAYAFARNMHFGVRGVDVEELQKMLVESGHLKLATTTQYFGPLTKAAVIRWQKANKLPATGYFGPMSRAVVVK